MDVGERFDKYEIVRKLAVGGMAEIYLARFQGPGGFQKEVVIKRLLPDFFQERSFQEMFLNEAKIAAQLQHPNIAQIHDFGVIGDEYFIIMEFVQGQNLQELLRMARRKSYPLPLADTVKIMSQVCLGLSYAHTARGPDGRLLGVIHRDVSPSNIMISYEGSVKVLDFGVAKATTQDFQTQAGVVKGKYNYMSPEQALARPIDARSDIFSAGVVLWEVTTGHRLFKRKTVLEVMEAITRKTIPPPSSVWSEYPPDLEKIAMKALERQPSRRYQRALDLHMDLERFLLENNFYSGAVSLGTLMKTLFAEKFNMDHVQEPQITPTGLRSPLTPTGVPAARIALDLNRSPDALGGNAPHEEESFDLPLNEPDPFDIPIEEPEAEPPVASHSAEDRSPPEEDALPSSSLLSRRMKQDPFFRFSFWFFCFTLASSLLFWVALFPFLR